jgi:tetratricopeptide (TPR) repeat protein
MSAKKEEGKARRRRKHPILRGCLWLCISIAIIVITVVAVLDWINFAFMPLDLLRPMGVLDIRCVSDEAQASLFGELLRGEGGVQLEIRDAQGRPLPAERGLPSRTDVNGQAKLYLPRGKYRIHAEIEGVVAGELHRLATSPDPEIAIRRERRPEPLELVLAPVTLPDEKEEDERLSALLVAGEYEEAERFVTGILPRRSGDSWFRNAAETTVELAGIAREMRALPLAAYNSQIELALRMVQLVSRVAHEGDPRKFRFRFGTMAIPIVGHVKALREARDQVITEHLDNFQRFLASNNRVFALEQWLKVAENEELYREGADLDPAVALRIEELEPQIEELEVQVKEELEQRLEAAKDLHDRGRIAEARAEFSDLRRRLPIFLHALELDERVILTCESYLDDLRLLAEAEDEYTKNHYEEALMIYEMVAHQSPWLERRIREVGELL